jgi:hypothetical protein
MILDNFYLFLRMAIPKDNFSLPKQQKIFQVFEVPYQNFGIKL